MKGSLAVGLQETWHSLPTRTERSSKNSFTPVERSSLEIFHLAHPAGHPVPSGENLGHHF